MVPAGACRRRVPQGSILRRRNLEGVVYASKMFLKVAGRGSGCRPGNVPLLLTREAMAQQRGGGMAAADPFKPTDGANSPMGVGEGDPPGQSGMGAATPRPPVGMARRGTGGTTPTPTKKRSHRMTSRLLLNLTGRKNDKQAWDALFRSFNETRKLGNSGYRPGETIAIKINCNQDRTPEWGVAAPAPAGGPPARPGAAGAYQRGPLNGLPSPHAVRGPGDATDRSGRGAGRRHHDLRCRGRAQCRPTHLHQDQGEFQPSVPGGEVPGGRRL